MQEKKSCAHRIFRESLAMEHIDKSSSSTNQKSEFEKKKKKKKGKVKPPY